MSNDSLASKFPPPLLPRALVEYGALLGLRAQLINNQFRVRRILQQRRADGLLAHARDAPSI